MKKWRHEIKKDQTENGSPGDLTYLVDCLLNVQTGVCRLLKKKQKGVIRLQTDQMN
jgi:hypothetical protein